MIRTGVGGRARRVIMKRSRALACFVLGAVVVLGLAYVYVTETDRARDDARAKESLARKKAWHRKYFGLHLPEPGDKENLEELLAERKWKIEKICRRLSVNDYVSTSVNEQLDPKTLDHIIVDDEHRLLYCYVPKVACTNWKRIFMILQADNRNRTTGGPLTGNNDDILTIPANESHRQHRFPTLDSYSEAEVQYRLRHYFKFLFARHPFERLLSAYRNKFEQQNYSSYFHRHFGRTIVERFRPNASAESLARGHDVTFSEFVRYVLDPRTLADGPLNEHWRPIYQLCHPCHIRYDIVGKYEALDAEAQYVLQRAKVRRLVPRFPRINRTVDTLALLRDYFRGVTQSDVYRLYQLYALDFKMFGYRYPLYEYDSPPP